MSYTKLATGTVDKDIKTILENPFKNIPTIEEAIEISKKYKIALHPRYLFYWNELTPTALIEFLERLKKLKFKENLSYIPINDKTKIQFENLGIEHTLKSVPIEKVKSEAEINLLVINKLNTQMLLSNLGLDINESNLEIIKKQLDKLIDTATNNLEKTSTQILNICSTIEIRDKGGTYIGARMGRPEKAKMRKMDGRPHGLFPVGEGKKIKNKEFGSGEEKEELIQNRLKSILEANKNGTVEENFCVNHCSKCDKETVYHKCQICGTLTEERYYEKYTGLPVKKDNEKAVRYKKIDLEMHTYVENVRKIIGEVELPKLVKGIKETTNKHRITEHLSKAFLRARNDVYVNKDGTVRFDMIEMGLTHFKAKEIETTVKKLIELGYTHDYLGKPLENDDQLLEIFPQDVILPDCVESGDELASDYVIKTATFVDDCLDKIYKLPKFYNFKTKEDTVGHLIIGLAPHTSAGIVGRIIGYSKTQGCFSHPVWHAAQRRNLDGDENGIMMLLDGLINFSRSYLPDRRGSRSVTSDTIIFIEENKNIKTVEIGEYINNTFLKKKFHTDEEGFDTYVPKNLKTYSFDKKGKVTLNPITKLIRHKCDKKVYEIKTSDGWIKTTEDHSIFVIENETGEIKEKSVRDLKKGEFLVTLGSLKNKISTPQSVNVKDLNIKQDIRGTQIPNIINLNQSFYRILGFILAEGHIKNSKIEIGNTDIKIINTIIKDIKSILNYTPQINEDKREHKYTNKKYYRINLPIQFGRILIKLGLDEEKAKNKEVPSFVFNTTKENIESFIEGHMLGDGTSYMKDSQRKMIRLYTSSIKLASGLSLLAFLCNKKSTCRKSHEKLTNSEKYEVCISEFKPRSSFWPIRYLRNEINEGLKIAGINTLKRGIILANIKINKARTKSASKQKIKEIISYLEKSPKNDKIITKLNTILNQNIRAEIVNEVKEINYEGNVYDLEVPKNQNFLCGPHPIFAHNTMDTSLVLTSHLYLDQIDDEVHGMDIVPNYTLEMYRAAKEYKSPKEIKVENIGKRIEKKEQDEQYLGYGFTHNNDNLNNTILCSSYKSVPSMKEKMELQLGLGTKIRAVDEHKVGSFIIDKHFMKDIKGNLRKFGMQTFRCTACNTSYRRPPLNGRCAHCRKTSINFTIHEGSIKKYLGPSFDICKNYNVDPYIVETLELANLRIEGVFGKEIEKQKGLNDFFGK